MLITIIVLFVLFLLIKLYQLKQKVRKNHVRKPSTSQIVVRSYCLDKKYQTPQNESAVDELVQACSVYKPQSKAIKKTRPEEVVLSLLFCIDAYNKEFVSKIELEETVYVSMKHYKQLLLPLQDSIESFLRSYISVRALASSIINFYANYLPENIQSSLELYQNGDTSQLAFKEQINMSSLNHYDKYLLLKFS
ncbi:MAG: hypothetical protein HQL46_15365 [Gammaproteobacteria bacterium]|nr:hypothetical protein [Gammaproteobacteria bacterium]